MGRKPRVSTDTTKTFGIVLSNLVEEKQKKSGILQEDIAREIGVPSGSLSEWCSDNQTASIDGLRRVADYFKVSTDYLLGLSEVSARNENIQDINIYTGLSQGAIIKLHINNVCGERMQASLISKMIENPDFDDFAYIAWQYLFSDDDYISGLADMFVSEASHYGSHYRMTGDSEKLMQRTLCDVVFWKLMDTIKESGKNGKGK